MSIDITKLKEKKRKEKQYSKLKEKKRKEILNNNLAILPSHDRGQTTQEILIKMFIEI